MNSIHKQIQQLGLLESDCIPLIKEHVKTILQSVVLPIRDTPSEMFSIVDMTSEMIERKLQSLAIREQTVLACWTEHGEGFQIRWDLFASRFDDFWYPSSDDIIVTTLALDWILEISHEETIRFFRRNQKTAASETDWQYFRDLASRYKLARNFEMAISCLKKSLELIPEKLLFEIVLIKNALACHYIECEDFANAEMFAREVLALELANRNLGRYARYLGQYYMNLSVILEKQNRWAEANANAKKAMEVFVEVMGKDHPFTIVRQKYQDRLDKMAEEGGT